MKDFSKFLEEVTIKGNPAIPGEGYKQPGDKDYLSDIERRAKDRLGVTGRENPMEIGQRMGQLIGQSQRLTAGKETELEELALQIIQINFGDILEGVELDIKLVKSGKDVDKFIKQESEQESEQDMPNFRDITDPELISRIHKAKIGNNIIQGEAKNTKHILHTDEVKEGLRRIFGNNADNVFQIWDELTKLADKMDWIIPIEIKSRMMEENPEGLAGAVKIKFEEKEKKEKEESEEDFVNRILQDLSSGENPDEEDIENFQEEIAGTTPVIKARGVDFPMLLHETVKGIYELIVAVSQPGQDASPEEIRKAKIVKINVSSFKDEAEDFRTGPEIAADFRDFINENPDSSYHPNMREFILGKMMDELYISHYDFEELFRGILNKTDDARRKVDSMISEVVEELKKHELGEVLGHEEESEDGINYDALGLDKPEEPEKVSDVDYSELTQREIQSLIDDALDKGDFKEVEKLSQYLKEGKEIYLKELQLIKESHQFHTRR
jgi:hypothetical protein